ncbi:hypothetical protein JWG44_09580 [Leptospira sp. 201903071]|uniref:hypothetical protein n=1 Tax=Leptospira ainazelensis TaxID=2810034 RepID=UPI00196265B7|nr:hypothetical protein [Leptospira ainazelensis]MBM9500496.1 hypothetical protein [Leptospira ainazelensis]
MKTQILFGIYFLFLSCSSGDPVGPKEIPKTDAKEDPCIEDRKKFCENQPSRRGITRECMSQNAYYLSPDCKAYLIQKGRIR